MLSKYTDEQINDFITVSVNAKCPKKGSKDKNKVPSYNESNDERTPEEELDESYNRIKTELRISNTSHHIKQKTTRI